MLKTKIFVVTAMHHNGPLPQVSYFQHLSYFKKKKKLGKLSEFCNCCEYPPMFHRIHT